MTSPNELPQRIALSWLFKVVVSFVCLFTLVTLGIVVYITIKYPQPTSSQEAAVEFCKELCAGGFGAILGLIGGKGL